MSGFSQEKEKKDESEKKSQSLKPSGFPKKIETNHLPIAASYFFVFFLIFLLQYNIFKALTCFCRMTDSCCRLLIYWWLSRWEDIWQNNRRQPQISNPVTAHLRRSFEQQLATKILLKKQYILQFEQTYFTIWTNTFRNLHNFLAIWTNTFFIFTYLCHLTCNLGKYILIFWQIPPRWLPTRKDPQVDP